MGSGGSARCLLSYLCLWEASRQLSATAASHWSVARMLPRGCRCAVAGLTYKGRLPWRTRRSGRWRRLRNFIGSSFVHLAGGLTADTECLCDRGPTGTEPTQSSDLDFHGQRGGIAGDHQPPQAVHVDVNSSAWRPLRANHWERVSRWSDRDRRPTRFQAARVLARQVPGLGQRWQVDRRRRISLTPGTGARRRRDVAWPAP